MIAFTNLLFIYLCQCEYDRVGVVSQLGLSLMLTMHTMHKVHIMHIDAIYFSALNFIEHGFGLYITFWFLV